MSFSNSMIHRPDLLPRDSMELWNSMENQLDNLDEDFFPSSLSLNSDNYQRHKRPSMIKTNVFSDYTTNCVLSNWYRNNNKKVQHKKIGKVFSKTFP